jgi:hypothetical protein
MKRSLMNGHSATCVKSMRPARVKTTFRGFDNFQASCPDISVPLSNGQAACKPQILLRLGMSQGIVNPILTCQVSCITGNFPALPMDKLVSGIGADLTEARQNLQTLKAVYDARCTQAGGTVSYGNEYSGSAQTPSGVKPFAAQEGLCR